MASKKKKPTFGGLIGLAPGALTPTTLGGVGALLPGAAGKVPTGPAKGLPATPAPSAPAAPAAPPPDPALDGLIAGILRNRDTTVGQLEAQRPQVLADYGYKAAGYDPTGAATGLTFDASNPFSKAALLLRNYNQQQSGTKNSMASRGQLYSGAFTRGKRENEFGYQRNDDALKKALTSALTGIAGGIAGAKTKADTDISQARLSRAPQP